jgi:hypothetical protein
MTAVKPVGVTHSNPMASPAQILLLQLQDKVVVIVHQLVGVQYDPESLDHRSYHLQETAAISPVTKYRLAFITTPSDVIPTPDSLYPQRPAHPLRYPHPTPRQSRNRLQLYNVQT